MHASGCPNPAFFLGVGILTRIMAPMHRCRSFLVPTKEAWRTKVNIPNDLPLSKLRHRDRLILDRRIRTILLPTSVCVRGWSLPGHYHDRALNRNLEKLAKKQGPSEISGDSFDLAQPARFLMSIRCADDTRSKRTQRRRDSLSAGHRPPCRGRAHLRRRSRIVIDAGAAGWAWSTLLDGRVESFSRQESL